MNKILIASLLLTIPSCVADVGDNTDESGASPPPAHGQNGDVIPPLTEAPPAEVTAPIEIYTECSVAPISGGCSTPPVAVFGPAPGPYAGYSHSTCTGPANGRCWDKTVGGTLFRTTIEVSDWEPMFNENFDIPELSGDGTMWNFPSTNNSYITKELQVPDGCRLKWARLNGWIWPNFMSLDYLVRRSFGGTIINQYVQPSYGGWGPISYAIPASHLVTTPGDTARLEVGTAGYGFSITTGEYVYNCPGI